MALTTSLLWWAVIFLVLAIIAAAFGRGQAAGTATGIAKVLFVLFVIILVLSFFF